MISKAKSCPGGTALFNYVVNEKKGYELLRNGLSGVTPKELYTDMSILQQQNLRCINNTISIVLSPTIQDGTAMSNKDLKELTQDFLRELKLDPKTNQFIAFVHTEKDHKHVHLLLNRVKPDSSLIKDSFISKKSQTAAHKIAIDHGFTSAKEIKEAKEQKRKNANKVVKDIIKKAHYFVLKREPKNLKVYQEEMKKYGIQVLPTINKQGNIQGFRFIHDPTGSNLKASEVDRNLKLNELFTNETSINELARDQNPVLQDYKIDSSTLGSRISQLLSYGEESADENSRRKRKRNSRNR
jgi:hypothetical protein